MVKAVRADLNKPVDPWFQKLKPEMKAIADELHRLILAAEPTLRAEMKWGMPCYSKNGMVCALMGGKAHVNLFFHRGKLLADPKKLLAGNGKTVRSLRFTSLKEVPAAVVKKFVKGAVAIDARS
jgi:hypothetical protein